MKKHASSFILLLILLFIFFITLNQYLYTGSIQRNGVGIGSQLFWGNADQRVFISYGNEAVFFLVVLALCIFWISYILLKGIRSPERIINYICPSCEEPKLLLESKMSSNCLCSVCNTEVVPLEGFYDRKNIDE